MQDKVKQQAVLNEPVDSSAPDVMTRVLAYAQRCTSSGRFPYEGQWLTKDEIEEQIRGNRRGALVHSFELLLAFLSAYLVAGLSWWLISLLNY